MMPQSFSPAADYPRYGCRPGYALEISVWTALRPAGVPATQGL